MGPSTTGTQHSLNCPVLRDSGLGLPCTASVHACAAAHLAHCSRRALRRCRTGLNLSALDEREWWMQSRQHLGAHGRDLPQEQTIHDESHCDNDSDSLSIDPRSIFCVAFFHGLTDSVRGYPLKSQNDPLAGHEPLHFSSPLWNRRDASRRDALDRRRHVPRFLSI